MPRLDASRLVFLDETWATTNLAPRYGHAPRGVRALGAVPHGHWRTATFIGAARRGLVAPLVLNGAINSASFRAYVEQILAPALSPGDVVMMDNLSSHKVEGVREAGEAADARLLHLTLYSVWSREELVQGLLQGWAALSPTNAQQRRGSMLVVSACDAR